MAYYDDIFDRIRRRVHRMIRDMMSDVDEMEAWLQGMIDDLESSMHPRELFNERFESLRRGVLRPLISVSDLGSELLIAVDLPGSDLDSATVDLTQDRVHVKATIKSEAVTKAFGQSAWARKVSMYEGDQQLPVPVDPSTARVLRRNGLLLIRVKKALQSR